MEMATVILLFALGSPVPPTTRVRSIVESARGGSIPGASGTDAIATRIGSYGSVATEVAALRVDSVGSPFEEAVARIRSFDSPASDDAIAFLKMLPPGYPIPLSAHGEDELITLFWDTEYFYADMEFTGDGTTSVFTRRRGARNVDEAKDNLRLSEPFDSWGDALLGELAPTVRRAA